MFFGGKKLKYTITSNSEEKTRLLAKRIASKLKVGDIVLLTGDLGAGKTTFVGGVLEYFGYKEHVISPTFNILKCYFEVNPPIYHIDAYRLEGQNIDIGLEEYIEGNGITFIEWPIYIMKIIPEKHLTISINRLDDNTRRITIEDHCGLYDSLIDFLRVEVK